MKVQVFLIVGLAVVITGFMGCGSTGVVGGHPLENAKTVLVAIDRSKSMHFNDPRNLGQESIQAMIALAPPDSNFGVMTYGEDAEEIAPVTALRSKKEREELAKAVSAISLRGKTDFDIAFKRGREILSRTKAIEGSSIIVLTDSQHNCGDAKLILDTVAGFNENAWKVNALVVTPSRRLSFIEQVAGTGGGKAFHVTDARVSVEASLKLAAQVDRMFAFLGETSSLTILPGTRNVLFVAVGCAPGTGFLSLEPQELANGIVELNRNSQEVYTYPASLETQKYFDIMNISSPLPGLYKINVQGEPQQSHVLCNLPVEITFQENSIKELYGEGESVKVVIEVNAGNTELHEIIKTSGVVKIQAEPEGPGCRLVKALELLEQEEGKAGLLFTGDLQLFAGGSEPVKFNFIASLEIGCSGGGVWHRVIRTSTDITPGGSVLIAEPMNLDFGSHWTDGEKVIRKFEVRSIYPGMVSVKVGQLPAGFQCDIGKFDVTDELKQEVTVTLDPAKVEELGVKEFQLLLDNILENGSKGVKLPVAFKAGIFEIKLPEKLAATANPGKKFSLDIPVKVSPSLKLDYELEPLTPVKTGITREEDGTASLSFDVPSETEDGMYEGKLKLTPEVQGLSPRTIEVLLSVSGIPQIILKPKEIKLEAKQNGWVEAPVTVRVEHYEDVSFGVDIRDIMESKAADMLISGQYDCEFIPLDEWDGKKLEKGKDHKAKLRFFISTDLQSGTYTGEAELWVGYRSGKKVSVKVPVTIELKR